MRHSAEAALHRARVHFLSNSYALTAMLRVGLSSLRPLLNPTVFQAARRCQAQTFTSRAFSNSAKQHVLQNIRRRPTILSTSLLSKFSRAISTDAEAVVSRPSQQEAWKKFGITEVRKTICHTTITRADSIGLGHSRWNNTRSGGILE